MAAKGRGRSTNMIMKVLGAIVLAGFLVAVLRVFNWDIFAVVDWAWQTGSGIITAVSDWFTGNAGFRKLFGRPN